MYIQPLPLSKILFCLKFCSFFWGGNTFRKALPPFLLTHLLSILGREMCEDDHNLTLMTS